ncbi:MAG: hypothetical protein KTR25_17140 [Myxococcales bacterium]|nr:hypothetical protein [Myxococcales bacterium]
MPPTHKPKVSLLHSLQGEDKVQRALTSAINISAVAGNQHTVVRQCNPPATSAIPQLDVHQLIRACLCPPAAEMTP